MHPPTLLATFELKHHIWKKPMFQWPPRKQHRCRWVERQGDREERRAPLHHPVNSVGKRLWQLLKIISSSLLSQNTPTSGYTSQRSFWQHGWQSRNSRNSLGYRFETTEGLIMVTAEPLKTSIPPTQVWSAHHILRCKNMLSVRRVGKLWAFTINPNAL